MTDTRSAEILSRRAASLARPKPVISVEDIQLLAFRRSAQYAIRLDAVSGISPLRQLEALPGAPALAGLVAWRGLVIPAVDPARLLGMQPEGEPAQFIVVSTPEAQVALLVDDVATVARCDPASLGPLPRGTPPAATQFAAAFVTGIGLVLDAASIVRVVVDAMTGRRTP